MKKSLAGLMGLSLLIMVGTTSCNNSASPAAKPQTDTVMISGMKFKPDVLQVHKGDTVVWINDGIVAHNVTGYPDKKWTSDSINTGESWKKVIEKDLDYFCTFHPTMKAKIKVEENP